MLLLAMDTSTRAVTVALHDGSSVLAESTVLDARAHAEHLAPGLSGVLREAEARPEEVTHVVAGTGPGPFTGLRVGLVTARVFADAVGARLLGVCSLDAIAYAAHRGGQEGPFAVATDARRREVYWATYAPSDRIDEHAGADVRRTRGPEVARPADVPGEATRLPCAGRGPVLYPDTFAAATGPLDVAAAALAELTAARLEAGLDLSDVAPRYLRRPDVAPPGAPKAVTLPPRTGVS